MNKTQDGLKLQNFDPGPAARLLARAWHGGYQLPELPTDIRPRSLGEGYDVQECLIADAGDTLAGWKLGVGSPKAMRAAGLSRPLVGGLLKSRCHESGAVVALAGTAPVTVEFEIAFTLARDIAPRSAPTVLQDAVSNTFVTFELVLSRFTDRRSVGLPSFVADNVGFEALIVGEKLATDQIDTLVRSVVVSVDGEEKARAMAGDDLAYPWEALQALIDHAGERGITLRSGQIVSTGAIAKPFDISGRGSDISAHFSGGQLAVRLT